jgi:hypothetical protein
MGFWTSNKLTIKGSKKAIKQILSRPGRDFFSFQNTVAYSQKIKKELKLTQSDWSKITKWQEKNWGSTDACDTKITWITDTCVEIEFLTKGLHPDKWFEKTVTRYACLDFKIEWSYEDMFEGYSIGSNGNVTIKEEYPSPDY